MRIGLDVALWQFSKMLLYHALSDFAILFAGEFLWNILESESKRQKLCTGNP